MYPFSGIYLDARWDGLFVFVDDSPSHFLNGPAPQCPQDALAAQLLLTHTTLQPTHNQAGSRKLRGILPRQMVPCDLLLLERHPPVEGREVQGRAGAIDLQTLTHALVLILPVSYLALSSCVSPQSDTTGGTVSDPPRGACLVLLAKANVGDSNFKVRLLYMHESCEAGNCN
jgi:hypothetical protein